jgi:hypothetical protein
MPLRSNDFCAIYTKRGNRAKRIKCVICFNYAADSFLDRSGKRYLISACKDSSLTRMSQKPVKQGRDFR